MKLEGPLTDNLRAAINSAKRLRGHRIHLDTLTFWRELLSHARAYKREQENGTAAELDTLIAKLQTELAHHEQG